MAWTGRNQPVAFTLFFGVAACGSGAASDGGDAGAGATTSSGSGSGGADFADGTGAVSGVGGMSSGGMSSGAGGVGGSSGRGAGGVSGADAGANAGGVAGVGSDGFAVRVELASDVKVSAPTTVGIVTWALELPGITEAHIDFGLDTAYGMTAPVDLEHVNYRTVLVGMKPERTYHFRIVASAGSETYAPTTER